MKTNLNKATKTTSVKSKPGFWTHFAISMAMVGGMLAANFSAKTAISGPLLPTVKQELLQYIDQQQIATINNATLEFNHQSRHFIMLDQPDWLTARISRALQE